MKAFIVTLGLAFSLSSIATSGNTVTPNKTGKDVTSQQRMEDPTTNSNRHSEGSIVSPEEVSRDDKPMFNESMDESSSTVKKHKKIKR